MNRLRSAVEIERVRREGRSYAHPLVVLITAPALPEHATGSRAAVVAGRRIGGAVIRNRAKRLLREALRQEQLKPGWDLMLVARAAIVGARLVQVKAALHQLLQRSELAMS
ncbi:MAG: ribonuclease P protein component [Anaerolineales bacterium]|nr:ribonuclease P protein component [Anaerolineales bacterium]